MAARRGLETLARGSGAQLVLDAIGDGILVVDPAGIITNANRAAAEILGFSPRELIGQFCLTPLGATDERGRPISRRNAALFESLRQGKKTTNAIRQFVRKGGERFWASITTTPIHGRAGTVTGGIIVFRDITEKKREEEYQADFARIASHNLRTPLGNVLWATEYLLSGRPGPLKEKQKTYLEDTHAALQGMNQLVTDLLRAARLQTRKLKPHLETLAFADLVRDVMKESAYYARAQNVRVELETDGARPHHVKADREHLRTIVQNLLENAIRYAFAKTVIRLTLERKGRKTVFSCTNEGIGIPKEHQQFIFAKFFRAPNAVRTRGDGTGLGLYVTYGLVKLNRGVIWFQSTPGKTTTFSVALQTAEP